MGLISRVSSRTYRYNMIDTKSEQVFEWTGASSGWKQQQDNHCGSGDSSLVVNTLPTIDIKKALARFNGYDINDAGLKQESAEEKVARLRREIEEVKHDKVPGSENLLDELNCALTKNSEGMLKSGSGTSGTSNLEARLAKLERMVGVEGADYTVPLLSQTKSIEHKLSLLDPDNLCMLETKMQNVARGVDRMSKNSLNDGQIGKMEEMERLVVKLGSQVPIIPLLADRLETLKTIHEKAADALSRNSKHHSDIEKLTSSLASLETGISGLKEVVASNTIVIQDNIKAIEARVSNL